MAIIKTRVPNFNGYRASILFTNGIAETDDPNLIAWFKYHGYEICESAPVKAKHVSTPVESDEPLDTLSTDELKRMVTARGGFVGNTKSRDKLISKLKEVM